MASLVVRLVHFPTVVDEALSIPEDSEGDEFPMADHKRSSRANRVNQGIGAILVCIAELVRSLD
jgi:hypothetical protein